MMYLIGGPTSVGKSTLAKAVAMQTGFSILSTDALTDALAVSGFSTVYGEGKAAGFFPYLEAFIKRNSAIHENYIIEGDAFFPKQVEQLRALYPIRAVFLVNSKPNLEVIMKHRHFDKWMDVYDPAVVAELPLRIKTASTKIVGQCNELDIECIDVADNFVIAQKTALAKLMDQNRPRSTTH